MRNEKALRIIACSLVALVLVSCATTGTRQNRRLVNGMIYDLDNRPLPDVVVAVDGKESATSDINGHFSLSGLKPGSTHSVAFTKPLHETVTITFTSSNSSQILYASMASGRQLIEATESALKKDDWKSAEQCLSRAEATGYPKAEVQFLRATLSYRKGDFEDAFSSLAGLIESGENERYVFLFAADIAQYRLRDAESAMKMLRRYLDIRYDPEISERYRALDETTKGRKVE